MANKSERHRLSLIMATLGPSTDDEKELLTMITAGIARQWTDGVDIARVVYNDGEETIINRVNVFRNQCSKRNFDTSVYLDTDDTDTENFKKYLSLAKVINPKYLSIPKTFGLGMISEAKKHFKNEMLIGVRVKENDDISDIESYFEIADFVMVELDSKKIVDEKIVERAKQKNCEPIYLAKMPTLMKGQVQSRDENFEIGHTLEDGFDIVALYEETSHGPYAARSVKCIDEIAVESEKLRVNPFGDLLDKFLGFFKK
ncbi:pyruvate kinase [Gammaproteobacteria bacterium]|nr:pyruvate kinase [Gammaproteobacteria bacterium]